MMNERASWLIILSLLIVNSFVIECTSNINDIKSVNYDQNGNRRMNNNHEVQDGDKKKQQKEEQLDQQHVRDSFSYIFLKSFTDGLQKAVEQISLGTNQNTSHFAKELRQSISNLNDTVYKNLVFSIDQHPNNSKNLTPHNNLNQDGLKHEKAENVKQSFAREHWHHHNHDMISKFLQNLIQNMTETFSGNEDEIISRENVYPESNNAKQEITNNKTLKSIIHKHGQKHARNLNKIAKPEKSNEGNRTIENPNPMNTTNTALNMTETTKSKKHSHVHRNSKSHLNKKNKEVPKQVDNYNNRFDDKYVYYQEQEPQPYNEVSPLPIMILKERNKRSAKLFKRI